MGATSAGRNCPARRSGCPVSPPTITAGLSATTTCRSTHRPVLRTSSTSEVRCSTQSSADAGVNFTDMTIDTHGVSLHPDQHAIASVPGNPNIVFIANDGGFWRLDGTFTDVSSRCAPRPITGRDGDDCRNWLSRVPTTIFTMNKGLGTLQFQSLSENVQNPLNDIMGGTQDNGTQAFNGPGANNWFVTIFG